MTTDQERITAIEVKLEEFRREHGNDMTILREDIRELDRSINGPPRDGTIRARLHLLESNAAASALLAASIEKQNAMTREDSHEAFTRREKIAGLFLVVLAPVLSALMLHWFGIA